MLYTIIHEVTLRILKRHKTIVLKHQLKLPVKYEYVRTCASTDAHFLRRLYVERESFEHEVEALAIARLIAVKLDAARIGPVFGRTCRRHTPLCLFE